MALLRGRDYAVPQDVFDIAPDVLRHRLVLSYEALAAESRGRGQVLQRILSTVAGASSCRPPPRTPADRDGFGDGRPRRPRTRRRTGECRRCCGGSSSTSAAVSTGCSRVTTGGWCRGSAPSPVRARAYSPGDDVRRMDWNVTARTTEPHVRESIADRELATTDVGRPLAQPPLRYGRPHQGRARHRRRRRRSASSPTGWATASAALVADGTAAPHRAFGLGTTSH